jgi:uncharacterized metal-binding protein YceD (DUF177 family)
MEIDLRRVEEGAQPLAVDGRGDSLVLDADTGQELSGWRFEGRVSSVAGDRRIRGSLTGRLSVVCDRCLAPIDREVRADLDIRIVVADGAVPGGRDEGVVTVASDASVVDLADPLRAAALLEVPIQNLCREDCRGICPSCGTNRNERSCGCKRTSTDPRWDALKSVFDSTARQEPKE